MHHLNREQETIRLTLFRDIGEILHAKRIDEVHHRILFFHLTQSQTANRKLVVDTMLRQCIHLSFEIRSQMIHQLLPLVVIKIFR